MSDVCMPELPEGYYWKVRSDPFSEYVIVSIRKRWKLLSCWWSVVSKADLRQLAPRDQAREIEKTAFFVAREWRKRHVNAYGLDVNGLRGAVLGAGIKGEYPNG